MESPELLVDPFRVALRPPAFSVAPLSEALQFAAPDVRQLLSVRSAGPEASLLPALSREWLLWVQLLPALWQSEFPSVELVVALVRDKRAGGEDPRPLKRPEIFPLLRYLDSESQ